MRSERKVIGISVALGLIFWVLDAAVDHTLFYQKSFWDVLIADLPASEIYMRLFVSVLLVAFGVLTARFITGHRLAEDALRQSEKKFRTLAETTDASIFIYQGSQFRYGNRASEVITGYTREELATMELWEIVHPDYRELVRTRALARQRGEQPPSRYEIKIITKGGEERWLYLNVALIHYRGKPAGLCTAFDITDLKQTEKALRESEATYRAFLEAIPDMIFRVSRDGTYVDYKPGKDLRPFVPASEFLGKKVPEVLPAAVAPAIMEKVQRALETGQTQTIHYDLPEEDGQHGYEARLVAAGRDEVIAIVDDITERKQMEAALRAAELNYRSIFENAMEGIFRTSEDGRIQMCNPALARMHGYASPEEMMESIKDTTLQIWVDPEKRMEYKRQLADSGFALGFEGQGRRKDGSVIWGLVNARAVRDGSGELLYYEGSVQDITERKQAEAALKFTQFAVDRASEAAFWIKPDGSFFYVNDAACQALGYTREELLSMTVPDIDPDYPQETWADHWQEMRQKGSYTFEAHHRTKDGRVFPVEITTNHLDYGGHEFNCAFARDITEGKRAERELRTLSTYLLRSQDQERRRIGRELHDSTAQKLAALGMNLSLINGSAASGDSKAHQHLRESQVLVQECLREIRTLSHLLHPPLLDEVGLASALRWYADGFAQRSGIRVDLQLPPHLTRMSQEVETTLFRVVQECLTNVHLHSGSPTARICILREPDSLVAAVTDEGRGMRSADRNGTTGAVEIGVGIAGMRERVEQFGGRLEIDSTNAGTTVKATLPLPEDGP